jgi:alkylhydroperoxidase/carboxymuconolactone decarboxylase family protein YurZ
MRPEQVQTLRKLALNETQTTNEVMGGDLAAASSLDPRTLALVRLATLVSIDSDASTFRWAIDLAHAAGVDDTEVFDALISVAPIVVVARLTSAIPHVLAAFDLDVVD